MGIQCINIPIVSMDFNNILIIIHGFYGLAKLAKSMDFMSLNSILILLIQVPGAFCPTMQCRILSYFVLLSCNTYVRRLSLVLHWVYQKLLEKLQWTLLIIITYIHTYLNGPISMSSPFNTFFAIIKFCSCEIPLLVCSK